MDVSDLGSQYGTWGNDNYSEYRDDLKGSVPISIGRSEGGSE